MFRSVQRLTRPLIALALSAGLIMFSSDVSSSQDVNYDESKVPQFELPDPLVANDGVRVADAKMWEKRREEILRLFEQHVYGTMPREVERPEATVEKSTKIVVPGTDVAAELKEVSLKFSSRDKTVSARMLCVLPDESQRPCPIFLGYNFQGNHTICTSKEISMGDVWNRGDLETPGEETRGKKSGRWPLGKIIGNGFGVATIYYGDIDPDFDDSFKNGVHALYPELQNRPDNWSSIGAWSWGLHRAMDYLETDTDVDASRVVLLGHSRLGKTALWAGATDSRFSIVISNNSGCGGAALARRQFGEKVARINTVFPHWFCKQHRKYNDNENALPVDQHMLISLVAPRPVYVASAEQDRWADPRGEFLSAFHAQPVYQLFGKSALELTEPTLPQVDQPLFGDAMGYHIRSGKHNVTAFDWEQYLKFCKAEFAKSHRDGVEKNSE